MTPTPSKGTRHRDPSPRVRCDACGDPETACECIGGPVLRTAEPGHCPDCGEPGERKGHQTCQYPQD